MRHLMILVLSLGLPGLAAGQKPAAAGLPAGARLFVAPMEWNLDRYVTSEIQRQSLPVQLVARLEDADYVMTSVYQSLGSHLMSPGHYIQVKVVETNAGNQVWSTDANDYALFFGRLRPHGPSRAAGDVVRKLHRHLSR
jgi:hypothetical protein